MVVSNPVSAVQPTSPVTRVKSKVARVARKAVKAAPVEKPYSVSCLEQAEICREQARDAARLRRFKAALGLFATAAALCSRAISESDETIRNLATDRLRQIDVEIATYTELARSMERPVAPRGV